MSFEKVSWRVPEKGRIGVNTEKWKNPDEYPKKIEIVRVSKKCPDEYRKRVELVWIPKNVRIRASTQKGRIRASIENLSQRILEKGRISVSIEKW